MFARLALMTASLAALCVLQSACVSDNAFAPVVNAWQQPQAAQGFYRVRPGDTLYSIAWAFGLDYRTLANNNQLRPPYTIDPGQELRMSPAPLSSVTPEQTPVPVVVQSVVKSVSTKRQPVRAQRALPRGVSSWSWPAKGRVVGRFSQKMGGNQGLDIAGRLGEKIVASAAGQVVYSGSGVRGYGNLIIIKHTSSYLSAYAFNRKNLVKDGMWVRRGQTIATMGRNMAGRVMLHFEIRKNGRPVNPLNYLRKDDANG